jgi:hypothetical protein
MSVGTYPTERDHQLTCCHEVHPVVTGGELVASVCGTCWAQCSPERWIRQCDAIWDRHERQLRIDACDGHERDEVQVSTWGEQGVDVIEGPCRKCGG